MSLPELVVRLAARLLPARMRDTHREQWLADLRDAAEADVAPSEIAAGSLAFAIAAPRGAERRRREPNVAGRSRLASALALSTAVLCMSYLGNTGSREGLTANDLYNLTVALGTAFMFLYMLLAPIIAIVLVATRGVTARVRVAVALFICASLAALAHGFVNGIRAVAPVGTMALSEAALALAVAIASLAIGCVLIARRSTPALASGRSIVAAVISLAATWLALGLGLANVLSLRAQLHAADVRFVQDVLVANHTDGAIAMLAQSNQATITAIAAWAGSVLVASLAVGWLAYTRPRHAVARGLALLFAMMITHAALLTFVWLNSFGGPGVHLTVPEAVLLLVGRWGLVAVVLYAVGGLRLELLRRQKDSTARGDVA